MDAQQLVTEGFVLMGIGMGMVFVFLTLLVLATRLMSGLVARYVPQAPHPAAPSPEPAAAPTAATLLAVIGAALHQHRARRRREEDR